MSLSREWQVAPRLPDDRLSGFPEAHPLVVQILHNRGVREPAEVESFLAGPLGRTGDPGSLRGVPEAVERISRAIAERERIAVYGDFDVDGVTSTALMTEAITAVGGWALPFIPKREDGYGLNVGALADLARRRVKLVVTVDCGISSPVEVAAARDLGIDVVITDHHRPTERLPDAAAVVDPRQPDCPYPFKCLAGVGVAFMVAQALFERLPAADGRSSEELERSLLDLVALGTVADVVPLLGENRVLACRGLAELNRTARPGLRELVRVAGLRLGEVGSDEIGYALGPRLNAAGRLGDPADSLRLLMSGDGEAPRLALALDRLNRERQQLTEDLLARARGDALGQLPDAKVLLIAGPEYRPGIVGLVAGRLADEFYRPAFVVGVEGEQARGSGRSIAEFDLAAALTECRDLLVRFGGHPRAGGFTVVADRIDDLKARLWQIAEERLAGVDLEPKLKVDAALDLRRVDWGLHQEIQRIAPFGYENPAPVFLTAGLRVVSSRVVGQSQPGHLRLALFDGARNWNAIGFGLGGLVRSFPERSVVDVVYHLDADGWEGGKALRLRVRGIRPSE